MGAIRLPDSTQDLVDFDPSTRSPGKVPRWDGTKFVGASGTTDVTVRKNSGADVGAQPRLNLVEGGGVSLAVNNDPTDAEVDITIAVSLDGGYF
jgi:hypothetical protein